MAQDHNRVRIRRPIFFRQERASERRFHAENIEIVSRNQITPDALARAGMRETAHDDAINKDAGEDRVAVAVILVVRIRLQADVGAVVRSSVKLDQLRWLVHGQRSQQNGVDQAEDGSVRANAERHGQNRERGESTVLQELAPAVANVLQKCSHNVAPIGLRAQRRRHARLRFPTVRCGRGRIWIQLLFRRTSFTARHSERSEEPLETSSA